MRNCTVTHPVYCAGRSRAKKIGCTVYSRINPPIRPAFRRAGARRYLSGDSDELSIIARTWMIFWVQVHSSSFCRVRNKAHAYSIHGITTEIGPWGRMGIYGGQISVEESKRIEMKFQARRRMEHHSHCAASQSRFNKTKNESRGQDLGYTRLWTSQRGRRHDKHENTRMLQPRGFEEVGTCRRIQTKGPKTEFVWIVFAVRDRQNGKEQESSMLYQYFETRVGVGIENKAGWEIEVKRDVALGTGLRGDSSAGEENETKRKQAEEINREDIWRTLLCARSGSIVRISPDNDYQYLFAR
ncbi:hypothetical protein B0H13DRAFT_1879572 [Mycena leptocephala]|nr:hypothetical protein B0H13DRAFT_1879572 [Mycena leptocephala]